MFAGHLVAPDVRADLAFTIGRLGAAGVSSIAGLPLLDALETVLRPIDGAGTHTFFSYRVAETLLAHDGLLDRFDGSARGHVLEACDSTSFVDRLERGELPRNYAAVLLRCEVARQRLGLDVDGALLERLTARARALLEGNAGGFLDDSHTGIGRYDIYAGDVYLFTEPFAERLEPAWSRGAGAALDLVERIGTTDGSSFTWGRSIGALSTCLTIELAGLVATRAALGADVDAWLGRGGLALDHAGRWFAGDGLITAHQHRSTFGYRGPFRRLQMTLDCLGKLADTAAALAGVGASTDGAGASLDRLFPDRDELVRFEADRPAGVWTYRSRHLAFVLPLVGSTVGDYLPAPRNPGLFEVPVDTDLPTAVPVAFVGGQRYTSGMVPEAVRKVDGGLEVTYDGFPRSRQFEAASDAPALAGRRTVRYRVEGRTLHADEELTFDGTLPGALAVQLSETAGRPLRVVFRSDQPHVTDTIDVAGLKEYRSFWSELPVVHQLDVEPAPAVRLGWSVTPKLRVLTTERAHHYHRTVLDPLVAAGAVVDEQVSRSRLPGDLLDLGQWDLFHLHWPEWYLGPDVARHRAAVEQLREAGVRIIWTQHNLVPHDRDPRLPEIYAVWAGAADGVVHHSAHGRRRVEERYRYRDGAVHRVIPHPHFGHLIGLDDEAGSFAGERTGPIRLGILGAPRPEKDTQRVLDAFAATTRSDLELHVWSLRGDETVPDDPRIHAEPYRTVDRAVYDERLRSLDALVLPFAADGDMLTTGTTGDVIGAGIAAVVSGWGYLHEALGAAGIPDGDDLTATLEELDRPTLAAAAAVARSLRPASDPAAVARAHLDLYETVGTTRL